MKNSDTHTIDRNMHNRWQATRPENTPLTIAELNKILKRNSLLSKLRLRAFILFILGLTGPIWILMLDNSISPSLLLKVAYSAFMLACSGASLYWWYRLGQVYHYLTIPLIEAQIKIESLDKLRRNIKICGWIAGAPVIALLMYEIALDGEQGVIIGALIGLVIGGTIGLIMEMQNRRQIKAVKRSFSEFNDPEAE